MVKPMRPQRRTRRATVLLAALSLAMSVLGFVPSGTAHADMSAEASTWPRHLVTTMLPTGITTFGNDTMSLTNCGGSQQATSFQYIYAGVNASSLPTSGVGTASPPHEGISCSGQGLATADGTFYTTHISEDSAGYNTLTFVAMKNGRALWSTDLGNQSDPVCSSMSTWGSESHDEMMTNASQGSDGNVYGLVQQANPGCATYLTGVSGVDGHVLFKQQLTTTDSQKGDRVWVYGDHIVTVDTTGLLRQFGYDGTENTSAGYQFPSSLGNFGATYANADGRVFAVGACTGSMTDTFLAYHDPNGDSYVGASGLGCNPSVSYTVGGNGSLVAYDSHDSATTFHFTTTSVTGTSVTVPRPSSAYYSYNDGYWQDQSGNAVTIRQFYTSGWMSAGMSVDYIDGSTGAVSNIFSMGVDIDHPSPRVTRSDIAGGYLYSFICHDSSQCPSSASTSIDGWIHKIQLPSRFGTAVKDTGGFATYTSTKLQYVAMGDSFSSGESDAPFFSPTDISGGNQCHRSSNAYPEWVSQTSSTLSLTDFTSCSGATTDNVLTSGQYNEPAQVKVLNDATKVVTITIGGNDVKFKDFAMACVLTYCDVGSDAYNTSISLINNTLPGALNTTYSTILTDAPNAEVYVVDYPQMVPVKATTDAIDSRCPYLYAGAEPWGNAQGAHALLVQLDEKIVASVNAVRAMNPDYFARLHFVDVDASGSPFAGHEVCGTDSTSWFQNVDQAILNINPAYALHPNVLGQNDGFGAIVGAAISAG